MKRGTMWSAWIEGQSIVMLFTKKPDAQRYASMHGLKMQRVLVVPLPKKPRRARPETGAKT